MHIKRSKLTGSYTQVANGVLRDRRLSFMARGILAFLLSLPDGARQDAHTLADDNPGLGRRGVSKALAELVAHGYYVRRTVRDAETGRIHTETTVYDTPQGEGSQVAPLAANPSSGGPSGGNTVKNPKGFKTGEENKTPNPAPASEVHEAVRPADTPQVRRESSAIDKTEDPAAVALVVGVGRVEPRLTVGMREMSKVLPLVAEWFARGATEIQIRAVLTTALPDEVRSPVALIIHRLRSKMPAITTVTTTPKPVARAECDECARPVLAPGVCPQCADASTGKPGPIADVARHAAGVRAIMERQAAARLAGELLGARLPVAA